MMAVIEKHSLSYKKVEVEARQKQEKQLISNRLELNQLLLTTS